MASSAAADAPAARPDPERGRRLIPELVRFDRFDQTLRPELPRDQASRASEAPEVDPPTLWTRWARSVPTLPLDGCDVEVESDLSFVRFSLSGKF